MMQEMALNSRIKIIGLFLIKSRNKFIPCKITYFYLFSYSFMSATSKKGHKKVAFIPGRSRVRAYLHPR